MNRASYGQPAFIGGLVMGVLSALPFISAGNLCCCLWVIVGGMVAAYMLQQNQSAPITAGDGALVGLLAGLIGAVVQVVVSIPMTLLVGPMEREMMRRVMDMAGNMPPEMRDVMDRYGYGTGGPLAAWMVLGRLVVFVFMLFIGSIFSTIGGLLGAAIFKRGLPPGTIDVTPGTPTT
jgi:hypothetical protein